MAKKLYKYKNKLKNKLKKIKKKLKKIEIASGTKTRNLVVVMLVVIASWVIGAFLGTSIFNLRNNGGQKENKTMSLPIQKADLSPKNNPFFNAALVNTSDWKTYRSQKYEFEIKYPKDWTVPKEGYMADQEAGNGYKISFQSFDILIRDNSKTASSPSQKCNNKENNTPKYILASYQNNYAELEKTPAENNICAVKEIRILKNDYYFKKIFVYQVVKGKYSYDIIPTGENNNSGINYVSSLAINEVSPEMNGALSTFKFKSADPIIVRPRIVFANLSCGVKNDHPSRSKTKGKHMDEDCCPDPDEWPKPGCIYSTAGLGLMLSGPKK